MSRVPTLIDTAPTADESNTAEPVAADIAKDKMVWRQRLSQSRTGLSLTDQDGQQLVDHVTTMAAWQQALTIAAYLAMPDECDPTTLVTQALNVNKRVAMPRISEDGVMDFATWQPQDPIDRFKGRVPQPQASARPVLTDEIDLFIVPLLGCDAGGYRLGYGGGYYDRALRECRGFKLGLCFEEQRVATLPRENHDVRLDAVVTPRGWVSF
jgi:5-formyltetrahydrofolate cyclo-ligase